MSDIENSRSIHWNERLEKYFADTGEKAHCYSWLHKKAEEMYSRRSIFIDLPVIILGVLNGATSIGSDSLFKGSQYASIGVGIVALITSILTTIGTYFSWTRRSEAHKMVSIQYAKLYRFLSIEMSLPRVERMSPIDLLKYVKEQYDRLAEISPLVPPAIIAEFNAKFAKPEYKDISKPEITNGLHQIEVFPEREVIIELPTRESA